MEWPRLFSSHSFIRRAWRMSPVVGGEAFSCKLDLPEQGEVKELLPGVAEASAAFCGDDAGKLAFGIKPPDIELPRSRQKLSMVERSRAAKAARGWMDAVEDHRLHRFFREKNPLLNLLARFCACAAAATPRQAATKRLYLVGARRARGW